MKSVYVLGTGQLGRMLQQAGAQLGVEVILLSMEGAVTDLMDDGVITAEVEHWPQTPLVLHAQQSPRFVNAAAIRRLSDRAQQKSFLDDLSLPTAPWCLFTHQQSKYPADMLMIKRRCGGYDGRGQWRVHVDALDTLPADIFDAAIAESCIDFETEGSVIGARDRTGYRVCYPCGENLHIDGMLYASFVSSDRNLNLEAQAKNFLFQIMDALDYVGVMAMEYFVCGDTIVINELAPRVHNSGHWSMTGSCTSQFQLHLRALLDWPLITPRLLTPTVMINLIGVARNPAWLSVPGVQLHWYNKIVRSGRKVGHLNICGTVSDIQQSLQKLQPLLPEIYQSVWPWLDQRLALGV